MPLTPYSNPLDRKRAAHLLRRATFGATKQQIDAFVGLTPAAAINQLFRTTLPDPILPVDPETGTEWVTNLASDNENDLTGYFKGWFLGQMLSQGVPTSPAYLPLAYAAREKVVLFLHSHFTAIAEKIDNGRALYYQNQLFRMFALDSTNADPEVNFKTLTKKVSVDNAMLLLLDGYQSVKGNPNENYARELLELYTIGRGLEVSGYFGEEATSTETDTDYIVYRESDVKAAANVLTGWEIDDNFLTLDADTGLPRGKVRGSTTNASSHEMDTAKKTFSERFGGQAITADPLLLNGGNATEASALDEIDQLIEMIYAKEETRLNICRKIYRFFVTAPHDEAGITALESAVITNLANTFVSSGYKIQAVIEDLLKSQHFFDGASGAFSDDGYGSLIKSPLDLTLGTIKFFNIPIPDMSSSPEEFYDAMGEILSAMDGMGMHFYEPYDVAGYDAYHQFPMYHRNWITVNYLANRYDFIANVFDPNNDKVIKVNAMTFIQTNFNGVASDSRLLLTTLIEYLFPVSDSLTFDGVDDNSGLTAARLNYFLTTFLTDIYPDPEPAWTANWNTQSQTDTIYGQLRNLFNVILQSPENQLA